MGKFVERFSTTPIFEGLDPTEIAQFLSHAENVETSAGETVIRQGEPGDGLYIISTGIFDVVRAAEGGSEPGVKKLARLEEMSAFGEMSLFDDEVRSASVVCVKPGRLKRISRGRFLERLATEDMIAYKITVNLCRLLAMRLAAAGERRVS